MRLLSRVPVELQSGTRPCLRWATVLGAATCRRASFVCISAISGPRQGHVRAMSGPCQGHVRAILLPPSCRVPWPGGVNDMRMHSSVEVSVLRNGDAHAMCSHHCRDAPHPAWHYSGKFSRTKAKHGLDNHKISAGSKFPETIHLHDPLCHTCMYPSYEACQRPGTGTCAALSTSGDDVPWYVCDDCGTGSHQ